MRATDVYRNLEFEALLEQLSGYAGSELTRQLIRQIEVVFHPARVDENLAQTTEALRFMEDKPSVELPQFSQIEDLSSLWEHIMVGELVDNAQARALQRFLDVCGNFDALSKHLSLGEYPRLADLASAWQAQDRLSSLTKRTFSEEGDVRDSASPALATIRGRLRKFEGEVGRGLMDMLSALKEATGEETRLTIRGNRFVVLLPRGLVSRYKGSILDVSGSGQSVYFEPAAISPLNVERQHLFLEEDQEVRRILREYGALLAGHMTELKANLAILVKYDYVFARARYARALKAECPTLTRIGGFNLRGAIHPLLHRDFVPEDLVFDSEKALIISGVNAGGKTVLLKLLGLYSLMAALGCYVPGKAQLPYIAGLHADIGDDQSALSNLSTFTAHLQFIGDLWGVLPQQTESDPALLVLIDEIGTGTEPNEGAAFAYGLIAGLLQYNVKLAVTTHYNLLKTLGFERDEVKNVCLEFDEEHLRPTYRILDGQPGQSFALDIAKRWGVAARVLTEARGVLGQEERKMGQILGELEQLRREAEHIRRDLRRQAAELARAKTDNEQLTLELKQSKERFAKHAEHVKQQLETRIDELLTETKRKLKKKARQSARRRDEYVKAASKTAQVVREQKEEVASTVEAILTGLSVSAETTSEPISIEVGDSAEVSGSGVRGEVLELYEKKGEAVLGVSGKRVTVKLTDIRHSAPSGAKAADALVAHKLLGVSPRRVDASTVQRLQESPDTLDIHGQTVEEASESLDEFISGCLLSNVESIRVMHGVGTGRLRAFVQDYLRHNKHVANVRTAPTLEGGVGVTLADLR